MYITKKLKLLTIKIVFWVLGRALQYGSKIDKTISDEAKSFPDNFVIKMLIHPFGPFMTIKTQKGKFKYLGNVNIDANHIVGIKSIDYGFKMMTGQKGIHHGYSENRVYVKGNLNDTMKISRCINELLAYLFPKIISQLALKEVPNLTIHRLKNRFLIYTNGIIRGK